MVDNTSNNDADPDFLQFVSQLKSYKEAVKNNNVDKSQEMQKLKEQIKSQFISRKVSSSIENSDSVSAVFPEESPENITQSMNFDPNAFSNLENSAFFTPHELNPSMGHSLESDELVEEGLENFIPDTDPNKFKSDEQVLKNIPLLLYLFFRDFVIVGEVCKGVAVNQVLPFVAIYLILIA